MAVSFSSWALDLYGSFGYRSLDIWVSFSSWALDLYVLLVIGLWIYGFRLSVIRHWIYGFWLSVLELWIYGFWLSVIGHWIYGLRLSVIGIWIGFHFELILNKSCFHFEFLIFFRTSIEWVSLSDFHQIE
ncbi:hypothetical protein RIR_jg10469.t1 [Rhizophagus irregularis DAOM 181602=DAOM 197198]|nr:hypothetical protein RIR_jg10469.t1 [Rhizophagus irregularis DAOM 181602=DAOM 197198]